MANHFSILAFNRMKKQKDGTLEDEFPRSVGVQYATGDHWRNIFRKNEETEPKQKQHSVVDVTGDGSCIGTWNVRSVNQGKLEVAKQENGKNECQNSRNQQTKMDWNG